MRKIWLLIVKHRSINLSDGWWTGGTIRVYVYIRKEIILSARNYDRPLMLLNIPPVTGHQLSLYMDAHRALRNFKMNQGFSFFSTIVFPVQIRSPPVETRYCQMPCHVFSVGKKWSTVNPLQSVQYNSSILYATCSLSNREQETWDYHSMKSWHSILAFHSNSQPHVTEMWELMATHYVCYKCA